jgi:hypothetical protein
MPDVFIPLAEGKGYLDAVFLLRQQAEAAVDAGLTAQFGAYDKDGDGRLSFEEYKLWRDER